MGKARAQVQRVPNAACCACTTTCRAGSDRHARTVRVLIHVGGGITLLAVCRKIERLGRQRSPRPRQDKGTLPACLQEGEGSYHTQKKRDLQTISSNLASKMTFFSIILCFPNHFHVLNPIFLLKVDLAASYFASN